MENDAIFLVEAGDLMSLWVGFLCWLCVGMAKMTLLGIILQVLLVVDSILASGRAACALMLLMSVQVVVVCIWLGDYARLICCALSVMHIISSSLLRCGGVV